MNSEGVFINKTIFSFVFFIISSAYLHTYILYNKADGYFIFIYREKDSYVEILCA